MSGMEKSSSLVGRLLLSFIFVLSGCSKIAGWNQSTAFIASKGIPIVNMMLASAVIVEVLGGLALLVGFRARIAAGVLFLFLIPTTVIFHNFWALQGMERMDNMAHFLKNLAIMGGLLMVVAFGPGPLCLDARRRA